MGIVKSDATRLIEITQLSNNGHHQQAAGRLQKMANEERNPSEKKALWEAAAHSRNKGY